MHPEQNERTSGTALAMVLCYTIACAWAIISLFNGSIAGFFNLLGVHGSYNEIYTFALIVFLGSIAVTIAKRSYGVLLAIGTIFGFVALTLSQEPLVRYLVLAAVLFAIGMYGMVVSRNAVRVLMSIELMINAVNLNLVAFARYVDPAHVRGQIFAIFILTVAAAEAAVGIAIVLAIYRNNATVDMRRFNLLKW
jgi:NAD(P)H-quinone oxidoreductase subunit 4L